jgi:hypothetical protein
VEAHVLNIVKGEKFQVLCTFFVFPSAFRFSLSPYTKKTSHFNWVKAHASLHATEELDYVCLLKNSFILKSKVWRK